MDLKLKDVAELLNVSETTVRRWLTQGKIPAYRLNHQYRFSRIEIEDWMVQCKLRQQQQQFLSFDEKQIYPTTESSGRQQFSFYRAVLKGGLIADLTGTTKEEIIRATMKTAAPRLGLDADILSELLMDREAMMPTALNHGIAVPHPRDTILQNPASDQIITVFPRKPIEYGALDGKPVHTLFFLFSSSDKTHLHLLAKLAHLSTDEKTLKLLMTKPSHEQFLEYIKNWESKIGK
jgi:nitrogen PTS system EIIA component